MVNDDYTHKQSLIWSIPFLNKGYLLTRDSLEKYTDSESMRNERWWWPTLKFLSFEENKLALLNSNGEASFVLFLRVIDHALLVACSCGQHQSTLCVHAYAGVRAILWHLGETYFKKLKPGGMMELAFKYGKYFDKSESIAGLDVSVRPELNTVFCPGPKMDLSIIFRLPSVCDEGSKDEYVFCYMILLPYRNRMLPTLLPCLGKLNRSKTDVKQWKQFLCGVKESGRILGHTENKLINSASALWKMAENVSGSIAGELRDRGLVANLPLVFHSWKNIISLLRDRPFVYTYLFYGRHELKRKPVRKKVQKITISGKVPQIEFELVKKADFYEFRMLVRVDGAVISYYDASAVFFILHQHTLYMLPSLRDAALAEWISSSGGRITVFKEHFDSFEKEVLGPLSTEYAVHRRSARSGTGSRSMNAPAKFSK